MGFNSSSEGSDQEGGEYVSKPGWYHFEITGAREGTSENGKQFVEYELKVRAGEHPDQVGLKATESLYYVDKAKRRIFLMAAATHLTEKNSGLRFSPQVWDQFVREKRPVSFEPVEADGCQFLGEIKMEPGKKDPSKHYATLTFGGIRHVHDPEMANVPKDVAFASAWPNPWAGQTGNGNGNGSATHQQPKSQPAATSGGNDDFFNS